MGGDCRGRGIGRRWEIHRNRRMDEGENSPRGKKPRLVCYCGLTAPRFLSGVISATHGRKGQGTERQKLPSYRDLGRPNHGFQHRATSWSQEWWGFLSL